MRRRMWRVSFDCGSGDVLFEGADSRVEGSGGCVSTGCFSEEGGLGVVWWWAFWERVWVGCVSDLEQRCLFVHLV